MLRRTFFSAAPAAFRSIKFVEVGPRDGLQNESKILSVDERVELIQRLANANITDIEAGSLVNYDLVPQMKHSAEVCTRLAHLNDRHNLSLLVPHKSFVSTIPSNVKEVVLFVSASEKFNAKNINTTSEGAFRRFQAIVDELREKRRDIKVRGSISCCFGCPYEGPVPTKTVMRIIDKYVELNVDCIDICDTIGVATPQHTVNLLFDLFKLNSYDRHNEFGLHLHNTNGQAVKCAVLGASYGINSIHGSIAGLGGCPFSSKRVGNVDSVEVIQALHSAGFQTGVDLSQLKETQAWVLELLRSKDPEKPL